MVSKASISGGLSKRSPYIYCIYAREFGFAYIGQTNSASGPLMRLAQHLSDSGGNTFKQRVMSLLKLDYVQIKDVEFCAVELNFDVAFSKIEYREAIEFEVNKTVINAIRKAGIKVVVVSRVFSNGYVNIDLVQRNIPLVHDKIMEWLRTIAGL